VLSNKDDSPSGVLISTLAEYDSQGLTPRRERKDAKDAKSGTAMRMVQVSTEIRVLSTERET